MANPLVSVIIPVYNVQKYLKKCIDSVLNQTFSNFELILVSDGGPEDNRICDEYAKKDKRIILVKDVKQGLGGARNAGIEISKGEYILFIDSDDWIEKDTLQKTVECFSNDIDMVVFGVNVVEEDFKTQKGLKKYLELKYNNKQSLNKNIIFNTNVHTWNKLYKASIIKENNITFPSKTQYEDFPFYYHYCFCAKNAYFLNEKLYNYLQRKDSGMAKTFKGDFSLIVDHLKCLEFLFDKIKNNNEYRDFFAEVFNLLIYAGLRYCKKEDKIKYLQKTYETYKKLNLSNNNIPTLKLLENKQFEDILNKVKYQYRTKFLGFIPLKVIISTNNKIKFYLFNKLLILSLKFKEING